MLRKVLIIFSSLLSIVVVAVLLVPSKHYAAYIEQKLIRLANENSMRLAITSPSLSGLGLRAERINVAFPEALIAAELENFKAGVELMSLLMFRPKLRINANPYEGHLSARLARRKSLSQVDVSLQDLNINLHPQISGLGIERGRLTIQDATLTFSEDALESFYGKLFLSDVQKTKKTVLPVVLMGFPQRLEIPAFTDLEALATLQVQDTEMEISEVRMASSLFRLMGSGSLSLNQERNFITGYRVEAEVEISEDGSSVFGMYLPLISNGQLTANSRQFSLALEGDGNRIQSNFTER